MPYSAILRKVKNSALTYFYMNAENYSPLGTVEYRLRVVSNFGDGDCKAGEIHTRARGKFRVASPRNFAHPTIAIAKIRDYSQSK